ncbi:unnamed protein product [Schistosoma haematobium]|nr:unnamed protein product [Schistosoma haematobium]
MLIIYIIIPLILIRSCQSGSSSKPANCTVNTCTIGSLVFHYNKRYIYVICNKNILMMFTLIISMTEEPAYIN